LAACGVDLGGTKCLGVVLDAGEIVAEHRVPTPEGDDAVVSALAGVVETLREATPFDAVGVGAPGLVDREGVLHFAPNLTVSPGLALRSVLEERLGLSVSVDNDATCAAWGERQWGAARGFDHVVMATLGTGIGGGIVADGQVYRGANGFAGEIGHMGVHPEGPDCRCGQQGCWERYASGGGLGRLARDAASAGSATRVVELAGGDGQEVRGEHVTRAVAEGDPEAIEIMDRFAGWVALGLADLANIFDPQVLVLGGGLVTAGEALLAPVRRAFRELLAGAEWRPEVKIVTAELGAHAGAIGAADLAS